MSEHTRMLVDPDTGEPVEVADDQVVAKRPFIDTMTMLEAGKLLDELTDLQHEVVKRVEQLRSEGKLSIQITYKPDGPQIAVVATVASKVPKAKRGTTLFYADEGNLSREHPLQRKLALAQQGEPNA